ncbi:MAG: DUF177 domain-containing protein [Cyanothece sp. SIO1E1]|nr:DUF177 domain-containing protein [Cyanothece sp. SIO1E1]
MEAVYIPNLVQAPAQTEIISVQAYIPELATLTPIRGEVKICHRGNYLEVFVEAETIITLTCDRCLKQYNYRLAINTSEIIWLAASTSNAATEALEVEVAFEDLIETLSPQGYFQTGDWLYQQLCLAIPQQQLCDPQCLGIQVTDDQVSNPLADRRWAQLAALKNQFSEF